MNAQSLLSKLLILPKSARFVFLVVVSAASSNNLNAQHALHYPPTVLSVYPPTVL